MTTTDPLQCTYEDARRVNLLQGMALSTSAKIAFFEEMLAFAARFGARDRLAGRRLGKRGRSALPSNQTP